MTATTMPSAATVLSAIMSRNPFPALREAAEGAKPCNCVACRQFAADRAADDAAIAAQEAAEDASARQAS